MTATRNFLWFVSLAIAWGTAFVAIEVGLEAVPPLLFAALRLDVATLVFASLVVALGYEWRPQTPTDWSLIVVVGGLVVGAHYGLLFVGQSFVSSAVAAIILSVTPIVTPPLAVALLPDERIRAPAVVGLTLGLVGVVSIAVSGGSLDGQLLGVGLLFGSAVVFALGTVLVERLKVQGTLSIVSIQTWGMAIGAMILHTASIAHPGERAVTGISAWTPTTIAALVYLGTIATAGGFLVYFLLLDRVGATELSLINYAVPVVAALAAWVLLGDTITPATVAGFALILLGFGCCKIGTLWRLAAPAVGYGPVRPPTAPEPGTVVVNGNRYQAAWHTDHDRSSQSNRPMPTAD